MSHDLPFGADTLVIPFTFVRPAAPCVTGMSRMRPRSTYRLVPPDGTVPGGSIAPIRVPRSPWDPPASYARHSEADTAAALRLVSDGQHENPAEREERELLQDMPELVPHAVPPPEPHAGFTEPPPAIQIPILGGGSRTSGRAAPPARAVTPAPAPVGGEDKAARQSRTTLRRAMEREGLLEPADARQSHHLVPQGGEMNGRRDPGPAQERLQAWGIDIDSALNGAPLSRAFHARMHTSAYYDLVNGMAREAISRHDLIHQLDGLRASLIEADKEFQQTGQIPHWLSGENS